ncbi:hypothetical protein A2348_05085 [Candidatus Uhrbacteria bacterium RIFOXYB12_FULL_58_10]|uniref:Uncharacterized protein n=1 Tax=Candidatus Uhrbacteria bacterium RIFOXYB2_FULL_57_15 TaxID=1802422 RepID=A0A1F7W7T2_9BACT|nr:MAG: hypothetical protein A2348_05085 [Candidatus Uhrbacteria bacterium RIFOXYB12_FULL_58_10]OGL98840.1 MAG: hypothetical protein A2304_05105 [Candidatus Uhrbacteria bacterium RIFOXYB2_FULL_57_15]OGM00284.1 MAG: hypothetical protein A2501_01995 [Candidatus Uhrbacteria bacterium RIFOXYC12_FULL_57_11]
MFDAFIARFFTLTPPTAHPTKEGSYVVATKWHGDNIPVRIRRIRGELTVVAHNGSADSIHVETFWREPINSFHR